MRAVCTTFISRFSLNTPHLQKLLHGAQVSGNTGCGKKRDNLVLNVSEKELNSDITLVTSFCSDQGRGSPSYNLRRLMRPLDAAFIIAMARKVTSFVVIVT